MNELESWIYNLTEANMKPSVRPRWYKHYSFKQAFKLKDLSPASIDGLVNKMATNKNLLMQVNIS